MSLAQRNQRGAVSQMRVLGPRARQLGALAAQQKRRAVQLDRVGNRMEMSVLAAQRDFSQLFDDVSSLEADVRAERMIIRARTRALQGKVAKLTALRRRLNLMRATILGLQERSAGTERREQNRIIAGKVLANQARAANNGMLQAQRLASS